MFPEAQAERPLPPKEWWALDALQCQWGPVFFSSWARLLPDGAQSAGLVETTLARLEELVAGRSERGLFAARILQRSLEALP